MVQAPRGSSSPIAAQFAGRLQGGTDPSQFRVNPSFLRASKSFGATGQRAALFALRFYKAYLSLLFAGNCRFQPTCSQYSYEAIERFGVARGAWLTLKRLARCQPLSRKFGYDPVPENWEESEALAQDVRHSAAASHEVHT
jgi:putative membrane protein insertion efficiency factor